MARKPIELTAKSEREGAIAQGRLASMIEQVASRQAALVASDVGSETVERIPYVGGD